MIRNKNIIKKMGTTFTEKDGSLSEKILSALEAGSIKGGDLRGDRTAAIVIKEEENVDLSVDSSESPLRDLEKTMK